MPLWGTAMLGAYVGLMLRWCCALIEPYWIYLGSFGSDGVPFLGPFIFALKMIYFFARTSSRNWIWKGLCWAHVGPLLGHVGVVLGLDWAIGSILGRSEAVRGNFWATKKLGLEGPMLGSCRAFIGPCWGCLGPWLSYWVYLGPFRSGEGQFLGPFFRAKNHAILSTKKLGLEGPMLGSCRAFIGPRWGYLGHWLSLSGSISGPRIGCWRICSWEENVRWVLWVLMIIYRDWLEQRPSLESSGFLYKI